ncbi:Plus-end-directed kinesin ATPase protein [Dioscorea alata]|uniref:Plus-end-directed kinesin ATPase protein n=3 Tax=Dioscorea alata TaxID=55571 RepID=A0ACB7W0P9_DIOAL|nr:Plus-end-directed kinesin ATPase protein [Dioscorea alata]KAH7681082.1 Plus-end-directed kinesin ATPase protein [Dioscorea alata]KAH7681083.1 Plus-end-directed kinesin ATPase protein [Dioscorea alata]
MASRLQRSSISPFRSRKTSAPAPSKPSGRPTTPSMARPTTPSVSSARPGTPSSSSSSVSVRPAPAGLKLSPVSAVPPSSPPSGRGPDFFKSKENVTVTVRFRPLSMREINKGDEVAWYADGDYTVRNEYNSSIAYGFDRVFGPATTTRHVYDIAAQHVVSGAMQGINGTVFAYGVTSSGKTHTMHGEQKSPGIIPLAVKDVFGIIQETPGREFLLRVSYLEIYNEVINDLLDPIGQNLRIREDSQGTYVEGIKEEVVLSPAHALSLIASGEEHRHVGSNNFNLLSSRSHTIFTLTIESSPSGENHGEEDVTLSQLNLIDLAGSESSKTETTGLRRKEGSYINKSLLTLGTVISKLTDGKATHIPYRDSKLTRLLQSSLSGHGRVSLICTVTPASSNTEETHNTLKFAHRSKHVEIKASQNKIMDEKSLIKKYQREISCLKEELLQLKRGMMEKPYMAAPDQEDLVNLKLQLEAGQVKLQSRLEEEEQAKAALMGRIQRLTKLILVSTKNSIAANVPDKLEHRRRHSFGEDELAYLPDRKREYVIEDDVASLDSEFSGEGRTDLSSLDESIRFDKKNRMRGMLGWFKLKKPEHLSILSGSADSEGSASGSPSFSQSSQQKLLATDVKDGRRKSVSRKGDDPSIVDSFPERTQAGDLFCAATRGRRPPPTGMTIIDQMDLLREQVKMLAGEVALCTSSLKRLSEQAVSNPEDSNIQEQMQKLKAEIHEKRLQIRHLEQRMAGSSEVTSSSSNGFEMSQALSKLTSQLNEKTFELEIMSADNRILQEQLQMKIAENTEIQETVSMLKRQLNALSDKESRSETSISRNATSEFSKGNVDGNGLSGEAIFDECTESSTTDTVPTENPEQCTSNSSLKAQVLMLAAEIENLKQEKVRLAEEKDGIEIHCQKLSEEASYAKELAAAAAVELRNLAEEVTKISYQNAKLTADLAATKELAFARNNNCPRCMQSVGKQGQTNNRRSDVYSNGAEDAISIEELQDELFSRRQRETTLEATLCDKERKEAELQKRIAEGKQREQDLENELANMWVLVAKMKRSGGNFDETSPDGVNDIDFLSKRNVVVMANGNHSLKPKGDRFSGVSNVDGNGANDEVRAAYEYERRRCKELEGVISRLKCEDLSGMDVASLEELQSFHVEALSKICQEKLTNRVL